MAVAGAAMSVLSVALPALATPGTIMEYTVPTVDAGPQHIVSGPDGNLWFSENKGTKVGRMSPTGVFAEFPVPINPSGITAFNSQIWFGEANVGHTGGGSIGRLNLDGTGYVSFPVAANAGVRVLSPGSDGNLWFAEQLINKVGVMSPTGAMVKQIRLSRYDQPHAVTVGPDNAMWFTAPGGNYIGRIVPTGTKVDKKYVLPTASGQPLGITSGPDGNLWFVENMAGKIGRITPAGVITEFPLANSLSRPKSITVGADGNLWFSEHDVNKIGRITTAGVITEFDLPPAALSGPFGVAAGPGSKVWFTEFEGSRIGSTDVF